MPIYVMSRLRSAGFWGVIVLSVNAYAAGSMAAPDTVRAQAVEPEISPRMGGALSLNAFLQILVIRNTEIQFSKQNSVLAGHLSDAEAALYEPSFITSARNEGRNRQRTPDERLQNTFTAGTAVLDERDKSRELGIRGKLPSGGELSLSYKTSIKSNNLISQSSAFSTEYKDTLNLTFKQPLLRNAGRAVTETDRRVAELEHKVALQQWVQQLMKSSIDGVALYWQLYKAQGTVKLRQEALAASEALMVDTRNRIAAGKVPTSALSELRSVSLNREAELVYSLQGLREAQSKLSTSVNMGWGSAASAQTLPPPTVFETAIPLTTETFEQMLAQWPPHQIALIRQQQAQSRLDFARNQIKPSLDLILGYGGTGFSNKPDEARKLATNPHRYPDWYVGIIFEVPLNGNQKAQQQFLAQSARVTQSELELQAIRSSFANDAAFRQGDIQSTLDVLNLSKAEVTLRQSLLETERQRIQIGVGTLGNLLQKQADLIESKRRSLENQIRHALAVATWQYTQGSLLTANGIHVLDESPLAP